MVTHQHRLPRRPQQLQLRTHHRCSHRENGNKNVNKNLTTYTTKQQSFSTNGSQIQLLNPIEKPFSTIISYISRNATETQLRASDHGRTTSQNRTQNKNNNEHHNPQQNKQKIRSKLTQKQKQSYGQTFNRYN